jgi:3-oxoacyl-[acyl-carrier-protein] synthase-3
LLQKELGLRNNIGALDYNLGCSGFIYGLALAKGLVNSGTAKCVLLIMSETYSKHIHKSDKSNRSIFGDAAASVIIEKNDQEHIFDFVLGTDGEGKNNLIVEGGGMRRKGINKNAPVSIPENIFTAENLYMNGPEIFNFTIKNVPFVVKETIDRNNTSMDAIDMVIMHQANRYILDYLRKKIRIPEEKFFIDMEETGNTVSSTIPIAIESAKRKKLISEGANLLLVGFGVGYSWGGTIIKI